MEGEIKMSAIKDVYDLIEKLHKTTKSKEILEALLPIKEKILEAEKENLQPQEKILTIQREHQKEMSGIQNENSELQSIISNLKKKDIAEIGVVKARPNR